MKILWLTNVPSPYRVDFFNELGKSCDLMVLFEKKTSDERDKSWQIYQFLNFTGVFLNGKSVNTDTAFCPDVVKYIKKIKFDHIVVTNISSPTGMLAIQYMKIHRIPYWIEGDGGFAKSGNGVKEQIKHHFISGAKGYFSTSKVHDEYYLTYGAKPDRIYRYPFTSISKEYILQAKTFSSDEKVILRRNLGMTEKSIILSVGRFSYQEGYGKGYDILMRLAEKLGADYGFYLVGDEPTEEFKRWKEEKRLDNIHFVGFKVSVELTRYYAAADVFALLSRGEAWGLVINEAMAHGLPIVASDKCVAATELIENGINGYILPLEDEKEIAEKFRLCIENRDSYGIASLKAIEKYTTEAMARKHAEILFGE